MEKIKLEDIQTIFENLNTNKIERKGYIMLPSIEGFQLFEISEERLKLYLQAESLHNRALAETSNDASALPIPDVSNSAIITCKECGSFVFDAEGKKCSNSGHCC